MIYVSIYNGLNYTTLSHVNNRHEFLCLQHIKTEDDPHVYCEYRLYMWKLEQNLYYKQMVNVAGERFLAVESN